MARTITVFSNKGGVGKTFSAVNIATSLALVGKKVLIIDLDFSGRDVARMLNITPRYSIVDTFEHQNEFKDATSIYQFMTPHSSGLHFIPAVTQARQVGQISTDNIKLFLRNIKGVYDYIIIDGGKSFSEVLMTVFDLSNSILLVATPDILAVYQVRWAIDILQAQHFPLKMVKLLLNRSESRGGVAWQEVKAALPCDIIGRIPSDGKAVGLALNRGIPCVIDSPRSRVAEAFEELAEDLEKNDIYIETGDVLKVRTTEKTDDEKASSFWENFGITEDVIGTQAKTVFKKEEDQLVKLKREVHEKLVERLHLENVTPEALSDPSQAQHIRKRAEKIVADLIAEESGAMISSQEERSRIVKELVNEALGLGPLEELLADPDVTDIMVNSKDEIYIEKNGRIMQTNKQFISDQQIRTVAERIIAPLGRRIDESVPMVDARSPDGSRFNGIIPPLSLNGPMLTIRKFSQERYTIDDLLTRFQSLSQPMADFINACVIGRKNMIVSGGTGAGKTTLLNIISHFIPDSERIITIEDAAELKLNKSHWARLESRPPNVEGRGQITIRDLFVNTLRMRPDRIIIGECRGPEVIDMLQAMNTGHDGSLTTIHANSTRDVMTRLNSLILLSGIELPLRAVYEMIASAIDVIVHVSRFSDGRRRITGISELTGELDDYSMPKMQDIFVFNQTGIDEQGQIQGHYTATGTIPLSLEELLQRGLPISKDIFKPTKE